MKENTRYFLAGMLVSYTSVLLIFCFLFSVLMSSTSKEIEVSTPTNVVWPVLIYTPTTAPTISFEDAHNIIQTKVANYTSTPYSSLTLIPTSPLESMVSPTMFCYSQYPDFCISTYIPCKTLGHHNFTVLHPDPLNYDRDNDGVGCEQ